MNTTEAAIPPRSGPSLSILGVPFDNVTTGQTLEAISEMIASRKPHYIATANVDFTALALHDEEPEDAARPGPLRTHLERLAGRWQTEFMCNKDFEQRLDHDFILRLIRQKNEAAGHSDHPLGIDFYSASEWGGINE